MPIYEYICKKCSSSQEHLVAMSADAPACRECGEHALMKTISVFAVSSSQTAEACACENDGGGGNCQSGGCGCCG